MSKYTVMTRALLKKMGLLYWDAERFVQMKPHGKRIDMFHILDLEALEPIDTIGIQVCGPTGKSEHHKTITVTRLEYTLAWLESPYRRLWLISWTKTLDKNKDGTRGKRRTWKPHFRKYALEGGQITWRDE